MGRDALEKLLYAAVMHGQDHWDSYYGSSKDVLEMFLQDSEVQKEIDNLVGESK